MALSRWTPQLGGNPNQPVLGRGLRARSCSELFGHSGGAGPTIRAQAQGFLVLVTQGLGMLIGAQASGWIFNATVKGEAEVLMKSWQQFWIIPCVMAAVVMVLFFLLFRDDSKTPATETAG